jgi:hypothetical protein
MLFTPYRPFMVGTWVPGHLVAENTIEFERKRIWWDGKKYPDVLVFDKNYELKFALDGNAVESLEKQGYVYPWSRSHFMQIDPLNGRVRVNVDIAADDIVFGFYFYEELDLIYTALDVNPFTNPGIGNKIVPPFRQRITGRSSGQGDHRARRQDFVAHRDTSRS